MTDWNKQASRNNNIQPDLNLKEEGMVEQRIKLDAQEQIGIEAIGQEEKNVKPIGNEGS